MKKYSVAQCLEDSGCPGSSCPSILHPFLLAVPHPPGPIVLVVPARPSMLSRHIDILIILTPYGQCFTPIKLQSHTSSHLVLHHHFTQPPLAFTHCPPPPVTPTVLCSAMCQALQSSQAFSLAVLSAWHTPPNPLTPFSL